MKEKYVKIKAELCAALTEDLSNKERQTLGELFTLIDTLLLNKFSRVSVRDYNSLYKELMKKIVNNPDNADARVLLDRVKNMDVSEDGYVMMKLLQIRILLEGYNNKHTKNIVLLIKELSKG